MISKEEVVKAKNTLTEYCKQTGNSKLQDDFNCEDCDINLTCTEYFRLEPINWKDASSYKEDWYSKEKKSNNRRTEDYGNK